MAFVRHWMCSTTHHDHYLWRKGTKPTNIMAWSITIRWASCEQVLGLFKKNSEECLCFFAIFWTWLRSLTRGNSGHQEICFCYQAALSYSGMLLYALGYPRASRAIVYPGHTQSKVGFFFCPEGKQFWAGYPRAFSNIVFALGSLWWLRKIEPCTKACPKHVTNIIQTSLLTSL